MSVALSCCCLKGAGYPIPQTMGKSKNETDSQGEETEDNSSCGDEIDEEDGEPMLLSDHNSYQTAKPIALSLHPCRF